MVRLEKKKLEFQYAHCVVTWQNQVAACWTGKNEKNETSANTDGKFVANGKWSIAYCIILVSNGAHQNETA